MKIDVRKLRIEQQELLRQQAVQFCLQRKGLRKCGLLNVHPNTVGQWYKHYRVGGKEVLAIAKRGPKNAPRRLIEAQK